MKTDVDAIFVVPEYDTPFEEPTLIAVDVSFNIKEILRGAYEPMPSTGGKILHTATVT